MAELAVLVRVKQVFHSFQLQFVVALVGHGLAVLGQVLVAIKDVRGEWVQGNEDKILAVLVLLLFVSNILNWFFEVLDHLSSLHLETALHFNWCSGVLH